jgi:hypothetical protein
MVLGEVAEIRGVERHQRNPATPSGSTPAHIATTADVSSATGQAFFWSEMDEPDATAIAQALGGNTLEGLLHDRGIDMPDWGRGKDQP